MSQGFFLIRLKYFGNKCKVRGSIFGRFFESSKNDQKNIGRCPQALISHLKLIINHQKQKNAKKTNKIAFPHCFCLGAPSDYLRCIATGDLVRRGFAAIWHRPLTLIVEGVKVSER